MEVSSTRKKSILGTMGSIASTMLMYNVAGAVVSAGAKALNSGLGRAVERTVGGLLKGDTLSKFKVDPAMIAAIRRNKTVQALTQVSKVTRNYKLTDIVAKRASMSRVGNVFTKIRRFHESQMKVARKLYGDPERAGYLFQKSINKPVYDKYKKLYGASRIVQSRMYSSVYSYAKFLPSMALVSIIDKKQSMTAGETLIDYAMYSVTGSLFPMAGKLGGKLVGHVKSKLKTAISTNPYIAHHIVSKSAKFSMFVMKQAYAYREAMREAKSIGVSSTGKFSSMLFKSISNSFKKTRKFVASFKSHQNTKSKIYVKEHMKNWSMLDIIQAKLSRLKTDGKISVDSVLHKLTEAELDPLMKHPTSKYNAANFKNLFKTEPLDYVRGDKKRSIHSISDPYLLKYGDSYIDLKMFNPNVIMYNAFKTASSIIRVGGKPIWDMFSLDTYFKPKLLKSYDSIDVVVGGSGIALGMRPDPRHFKTVKEKINALFGIPTQDNVDNLTLATKDSNLRTEYNKLTKHVSNLFPEEHIQTYKFINALDSGIVHLPEHTALINMGSHMYMAGDVDRLYRFGSLYATTGDLRDLNSYINFSKLKTSGVLRSQIISEFDDNYLTKRKKVGPFESAFSKALQAIKIHTSPNMSEFELVMNKSKRYYDSNEFYPNFRSVLTNEAKIKTLLNPVNIDVELNNNSTVLSGLAKLYKDNLDKFTFDHTLSLYDLSKSAFDKGTNLNQLTDIFSETGLDETSINSFMKFMYGDFISTPNMDSLRVTDTKFMREYATKLLNNQTQLSRYIKFNDETVTVLSALKYGNFDIDDVLIKGNHNMGSVMGARSLVLRDVMTSDTTIGKQLSSALTKFAYNDNPFDITAKSGLFNYKLYSKLRDGANANSMISVLKDIYDFKANGFTLSSGEKLTQSDYTSWLDSAFPWYKGWGRNPYISVPNYAKSVNSYMVASSMSKPGVGDVSFRMSDAIFNPNDNVLTTMGLAMKSSLAAINNVASFVHMGIDDKYTRNVTTYLHAITKYKVMPLLGMYLGYNVLDRAIDAIPAFDDTSLGDGLTTFGAGILAKSRLSIQNIYDSTQLTQVFKAAENVMPGIINSPASGIARGVLPYLIGPAVGMKLGGSSGAALGGVIGAGVSILAGGGPLGMLNAFDISKSRDELIDEYTGKKQVPIRKGRFWELSASYFWGDKIDHFEPSWYNQVINEYKNTPDYMGQLNMIDNIINPIGVAERNMTTRPYPYTGGYFESLPFIGSALSVGAKQMYDVAKLAREVNAVSSSDGMSVGGSLSSKDDMAMSIDLAAGSSGLAPAISQDNLESSLIFNSGYSPVSTSTIPMANIEAPNNLLSRASDAMYYSKEMLGLRGFLAGTAITSSLGLPGEQLNMMQPEYDNSSYAYSARRSFWDQNLGGLFGMSEYIRRLMPKHKYDYRKINPLRNNMPDWMPGIGNYINFKTGDPFVKVSKGELRLPGWGYLATHDVHYDPPLDINFMGMPVQESTAEILGMESTSTENKMKAYMLKTKLVNQLYSDAFNSGFESKINHVDYDAAHNVIATSDITIGRTPYKVYVLPEDKYRSTIQNFINSAEYHQATALASVTNKIVKVKVVNLDTGESVVKDVQPNSELYTQDVTKLHVVINNIKHQLPRLVKNPNVSLANMYSLLDRFAIVADVAPYSKEFYNLDKILKSKVKYNLLSPEETEKYFTILEQHNAVVNKVEFKQSNLWTEATGSTDIISTKLINNADALSQYKSKRVFGPNMKLWETPVQSFIMPEIYSAVGDDRPIVQGINKFIVGKLLYGNSAGLVMAGAASSLNAINAITGRAIIPTIRDKSYNIELQKQMYEYQKNKMLAKINPSIVKRNSFNIYNIVNSDLETQYPIEDLLHSVPSEDKPYMKDFLMETDPNKQKRILKYVPYMESLILKKAWGQLNYEDVQQFNATVENQTQAPENWLGYSPEADLKDIEYQSLNNEALNARNIGLGFNSQLYKMQFSPVTIGSFDQHADYMGSNVNNIIQQVNDFMPNSEVTGYNLLSDGVIINVFVR